jgi:hypothetical protein
LLRTEDAAEIELTIGSDPRAGNDLKGWIVKRLGEMFHGYPDYFFTERDINSLLCEIANEELRLRGITETRTSDGYLVNLVHHEYPTPFRCDMKGYTFVKKDKPPYARGHYDLIILNPLFVRRNNLDVVCARSFELFEAEMQQVDVTPLIWVCEVIFFPRVTRMPNDAILQIRQDALKVAETLRHKVGSSRPFCRFGSTLVFASHTAEEVVDLKSQVSSLGMRLGIEIAFSIA